MFKKNFKKQDDKWSFQEDAILSVTSYFEKEKTSKNLLVIPTGGGKTITALRIISKLLDIGVYGSRDRIIWTVHSKILKQQAYNELNSLENSKKFNFHRDILKVVEVRMKDDARRVLCEDECGVYKLLVIDEAHHSAANTYKDFFDKKIGILGLTATPTRNDDSELNFDRIAYSITFRELMDRGVVIKPDFINPDTKQTISVNSLDYADVETMERAYNTNTRNEIISNYLLLERKNLGFQKVVVFVPNNNHVDSLYNKLCEMNEIYGGHFYIGFIYGEKRNGRSNDKNIENDKYLEWHKKYNNPSILINCAMLNEGYDDKNIDAVVMAVPTRSLLYYMQCIGRVVRGSTTNNGGGKAYVIEFVDNLPNFVYRIDNKWLFSDISDYLEPKIIEKNYNSKKQFISKMKETLNSYNVVEEYRKYIPKNIDFRPISLLLLKPNLRPGLNLWIPLVLDSENRKKYTLIFNELNNNIKKYKDINNWRHLFHEQLKISTEDHYFGNDKYKADFMYCLRYAYDEKQNKKKVERIIYVNFNFSPKNNFLISLFRTIKYLLIKLVKTKPWQKIY